jgi:hypothetical protein
VDVLTKRPRIRWAVAELDQRLRPRRWFSDRSTRDVDLVKVAYAQNETEAEFLLGLLATEGPPAGTSVRAAVAL